MFGEMDVRVESEYPFPPLAGCFRSEDCVLFCPRIYEGRRGS